MTNTSTDKDFKFSRENIEEVVGIWNTSSSPDIVACVDFLIDEAIPHLLDERDKLKREIKVLNEERKELQNEFRRNLENDT